MNDNEAEARAAVRVLGNRTYEAHAAKIAHLASSLLVDLYADNGEPFTEQSRRTLWLLNYQVKQLNAIFTKTANLDHLLDEQKPAPRAENGEIHDTFRRPGKLDRKGGFEQPPF